MKQYVVMQGTSKLLGPSAWTPNFAKLCGLAGNAAPKSLPYELPNSTTLVAYRCERVNSRPYYSVSESAGKLVNDEWVVVQSLRLVELGRAVEIAEAELELNLANHLAQGAQVSVPLGSVGHTAAGDKIIADGELTSRIDTSDNLGYIHLIGFVLAALAQRSLGRPSDEFTYIERNGTSWSITSADMLDLGLAVLTPQIAASHRARVIGSEILTCVSTEEVMAVNKTIGE